MGVFDPADEDDEVGPVDEYNCLRDPLISHFLRGDSGAELAEFHRDEPRDHFGTVLTPNTLIVDRSGSEGVARNACMSMAGLAHAPARPALRYGTCVLGRDRCRSHRSLGDGHRRQTRLTVAGLPAPGPDRLPLGSEELTH